MITGIKHENNFQIAKVEPQSVAKHLLEFLLHLLDAWFQPGVAYKNAAYKKSVSINVKVLQKQFYFSVKLKSVVHNRFDYTNILLDRNQVKSFAVKTKKRK